MKTYTDSHYRYPGSRPFYDNEIDRRLFFGRDKEMQLLLHKTLTSRLVVLYSKSGLGKTSLINAGLNQALRDRGFIPFKIRFNDPEVEPLKAVYTGIKDIVEQKRLDYEGGEEDSLWQFFKTAAFWGPDNTLLKPVLILDQFEEFFALHPPETRKTFIWHLADLVNNTVPLEVSAAIPTGEPLPYSDKPPNIKIIISIREDCLGQLEEMYENIPGILHHRVRLMPLSRKQAKQAIVQPSQVQDEVIGAASFKFSTDAVDMMLDFLCKRKERDSEKMTDEVEAFQLQLLCCHMEDKVHQKQEKGESEVVVEKDDLAGKAGMQRVLQWFYDDQVKQLGSVLKRKRTRRLCEKGLISVENRRLSLEEREIERNYNVSENLLAELVNRRLLRSEPRVGSNYYELSHDTLVAPIRESQRKRRTVTFKIGVIIGCILIVTVFFSQIILQSIYNKDPIKEAEKEYHEALKINKKDVNAYIKIGRIYYNSRRYKNSEDTYNQAIKYGVKDASIYYELGKAVFAQEKYDDAIDAYEKTVEINPRYADAYNDLGLTFYQKEEYHKAIEKYKKALEISPKHAFVYHNMGLAFYQKKEYGKAIEKYKKAVEIKPRYADAYYNMGLAFYQKKEYREAIEKYKKAVEIKPDYADAYHNMGLAFYQKKEYQKAIEKYKKAIKIKPDDSDVYNNMGETLCKQGKYKEGVDAFKKALEFRPDDADAYNNIKTLLSKKYNEVIEDYEKALRTSPKNIVINTQLVEIYLVAERFNSANALANKVLKEKNIPTEFRLVMRFVSIISSLLFRGDPQQTFNQLQELIEYYKSLPEDYQRNWDYSLTKKFISDHKKIPSQQKWLLLQLVEFLEYPLEAGRQKLEKSEAPNNIANALLALGAYNKAIEQFEKAIEIDPEYMPPKMNLAALYLIRKRFREAGELAKEVLKGDIRVENRLMMKAVSTASLLFRGEQEQALIQFEDFKEYYKTLPGDYRRSWSYSLSKRLIRMSNNVTLTQQQSKLLLQFMDLIESTLEEGHSKLEELESFIRETFK